MTAPVILSLSEIEAIALKAARGAGMSWGLAEEAAFATRWLAEQGLDGLTLLALHLDRTSAGAFGTAPIFQGRCWLSANPSRLCPIAAGAALGDHFDLAEGPMNIAVRLCNLSAPALILPFLAAAAARADAVVIAQWSGCSVVLSSGTILAVAGADHLLSDQAGEMTVTAALPRPKLRGTAAIPGISVATMQALEALVLRTYVPASEQSRRGAGAGGADNG